METVLKIVCDIVHFKKKVQGRALMTTKSGKYVTVGAVVAANAKLVGRAHGLNPRVDPHCDNAWRKPPSTSDIARAGSRALQLVKAR